MEGFFNMGVSTPIYCKLLEQFHTHQYHGILHLMMPSVSIDFCGNAFFLCSSMSNPDLKSLKPTCLVSAGHSVMSTKVTRPKASFKLQGPVDQPGHTGGKLLHLQESASAETKIAKENMESTVKILMAEAH